MIKSKNQDDGHIVHISCIPEFEVSCYGQYHHVASEGLQLSNQSNFEYLKQKNQKPDQLLVNEGNIVI